MKEILELATRTKEQKLHNQIMYKELKGQTQMYIGYKNHHGLSISLGEPSSLDQPCKGSRTVEHMFSIRVLSPTKEMKKKPESWIPKG